MTVYEVTLGIIPGLWALNGLSQRTTDVGRLAATLRIGLRLLFALAGVAAFTCIAVGHDGYPAAALTLTALLAGAVPVVLRTAHSDLKRLHVGELTALTTLLALVLVVMSTATTR